MVRRPSSLYGGVGGVATIYGRFNKTAGKLTIDRAAKTVTDGAGQPVRLDLGSDRRDHGRESAGNVTTLLFSI